MRATLWTSKLTLPPQNLWMMFPALISHHVKTWPHQFQQKISAVFVNELVQHFHHRSMTTCLQTLLLNQKTQDCNWRPLAVRLPFCAFCDSEKLPSHQFLPALLRLWISLFKHSAKWQPAYFPKEHRAPTNWNKSASLISTTWKILKAQIWHTKMFQEENVTIIYNMQTRRSSKRHKTLRFHWCVFSLWCK